MKHDRQAAEPPGACMRREIFEQPEVLARLLEREWPLARSFGDELRRRRVRLAVLAARGSSDHAAVLGKYILESTLGIPCANAAPSIATLYGRRLDVKGAVAVGVSQSGKSPDIVEYLAQARRAGALALAVTNDPRSPLARAAGRCMGLHAGFERMVATKTFTTEIACFYLLAAGWLGGRRGLRLLSELRRAPALVRAALERDEAIRRDMARFRRIDRLSILGRGYPYPVALEAALKFKEAAGVFSEGASAADFLHGPISMARRQSGPGYLALLLASRGPGDAALRRVEQGLVERGIATLKLGPPPVPDRLSPFPLAVWVQLAAYHLAMLKGLDPDRPEGIQKVTHVR